MEQIISYMVEGWEIDLNQELHIKEDGIAIA
jgi:hypothetical protein